MLLIGLQIWRAVTLRPNHPWMYASTIALISATVAITFGCVAWARRRSPRLAPRPTAVMESVPRLAYLISPFMIWPLLWMSVGPGLSMPIGLALGGVFALDLVSGFLLSALLLVVLVVWLVRGVANETRWTIVALGLALSVLAAAAVAMPPSAIGANPSASSCSTSGVTG